METKHENESGAHAPSPLSPLSPAGVAERGSQEIVTRRGGSSVVTTSTSTTAGGVEATAAAASFASSAEGREKKRDEGILTLSPLSDTADVEVSEC